MREPDAEIGLGRNAEEQADPIVKLQQRNERHLQRHHQQADDDGDDQRPARKAHPGERIGRESRDHDRDDRRGDRDRQRVDEGAPDAFRKQHGLIVLGGEARRRGRRIIDALSAIAFERLRRRHDECAVRVDLQRHPVLQVGNRAGRKFSRRGRPYAESADVARWLITEDVALDDELAVLLDLRRSRRQAAGFCLGGTRERTPPSRCDDLVLVAKR